MVAGCSISFPQPGRWVKGNAIGAGSFGVVNLAMNTSTGELFVVKSSSSEPQLRALENEADLLKDLDSPHIVQCFGHEYEANGGRKLNLFMEYMAGGSLSDVAEKFGNVLDESVIRLYARQILLGLDYLHKNGIVHCDVKCKNVLLGSTGNIKLADFGSAKRIGSSEADHKADICWQSICGTPLWMAPEVLRNEGLDYASDIWSLGCTIIEMVTGRPPWGLDVSNPLAAVFKIAFGNVLPQFPTKLSKEGLDFLDKCLQRDPKRRYTSQELLNHPFVAGRNLNKEVAGSPSSVLDVESFGSDDESDDLDSSKKNSPSRIPFSTRHCAQRQRLTRRELRQPKDCDLDNWITVRSG
ncbi:hypothetical protein AQUCO_01400128v1 [Aquilegia coerulea]|uniref:Protein kinase domain-containing protein n=1 Tax=Aquilegia coerulea TaxID=218851 RepID=A0A2G5DVD1_AQUCA|nr:hypothetical protein AQUCO_01400128v1 [Aquilegia coerulea]